MVKKQFKWWSGKKKEVLFISDWEEIKKLAKSTIKDRLRSSNI